MLSSRHARVLLIIAAVSWLFLPSQLILPDASGQQTTPPGDSGPSPSPDPANPPSVAPQPAPAPSPGYDPAIFEKPIPRDQLAFLNAFAGAPSGDIFRDKEFHKLMRSFVPDCMYHYGRDMPLSDALDMVFTRSPAPVEVHAGRFLVLFSHGGPYLGGRAMLWIDMQDGIGLGAFYFHPTNGEPSPTVAAFSKQVKEKFLRMSQLPLPFAEDLMAWTAQNRIPPITTRYFLTGAGKRILLEHDEDYCAPPPGYLASPDCLRMNADAADMDLNAAYYLEHVHYASNATAWMLSGDAVAWVQVRESTCHSGPDPLACRIRMTRERVRLVLHRPPPGAPRR